MSSSPNRSSSTVGSPSTCVVEAVAEREGASPLALSPPLTEFVDPDALDALFEDSDGIVSFRAWGYLVTVTADGAVTAERDDDNGDGRPLAVDS